MLVTPMKLARQAGVLLLWAATASRGLFAQQLPTSPETMRLRGIELRYVLPDPLFDNSQSALPIKALYVNAWAFGSNKLAQLVRLADSTEINAFVVDVKDDTGCLLYPSEVKVAQEIGATKCVRTRDVESRLDIARAHTLGGADLLRDFDLRGIEQATGVVLDVDDERIDLRRIGDPDELSQLVRSKRPRVDVERLDRIGLGVIEHRVGQYVAKLDAAQLHRLVRRGVVGEKCRDWRAPRTVSER